MLISNNLNTGFYRMSQAGQSGTITIPTGALPQNAARPIYNALQRGSTLSVVFANYILPTGTRGNQS